MARPAPDRGVEHLFSIQPGLGRVPRYQVNVGTDFLSGTDCAVQVTDFIARRRRADRQPVKVPVSPIWSRLPAAHIVRHADHRSRVIGGVEIRNLVSASQNVLLHLECSGVFTPKDAVLSVLKRPHDLPGSALDPCFAQRLEYRFALSLFRCSSLCHQVIQRRFRLAAKGRAPAAHGRCQQNSPIRPRWGHPSFSGSAK